MSDLAKLEMPHFIKTNSLVWYTKDEEPTKQKCRFNPFHVTSYSEAVLSNGEKRVPCIVLYCGVTSYYLDMTVAEVDEMIENVERALSIKE